jgi:hypothetical protein
MEFKRNFEDSLQRWRAFCQHSVADRPPLVIRTCQPDTAERSRANRKTKPVELEERFEGDHVRRSAAGAEIRFVQRLDVLDDTFPHISGPGGLAITGWLFGANVETVAGISWVGPVLERIEDWRTIDFHAARERFDRILECYRILAEESRGRYAIGAGVLEGPADMAVRMLGEEKLALALYEQPEVVEALFSFLAELGREFAEKKLDIIPKYGGGTVSNGYWVLGKGIGIQEDFGQMVSPRHFQEIILKHDQTLRRNLDTTWFHVHSGGLHMAREIVDSGAFGCIQITNDYPAGPSAKEMLSALQYIQKRSCLILRKLSLNQLDSIIGHLSPAGLAIDIQCLDSIATKDIQTTLMTHEEAEQVIQWAKKWMKYRE